VLFTLDHAGTGDEKQFAATDLNIADFEGSCQLSVPSCQFKTVSPPRRRERREIQFVLFSARMQVLWRAIKILKLISETSAHSAVNEFIGGRLSPGA
jgi:hypothetical protein